MFALPNDDAKKLMMVALEHLADWPMRSAAEFRNAILGDGAIAMNPLLDIDKLDQVSFLQGMVMTTIREGRMIDFGMIPNEVLKVESVRSRKMFEAGEFVWPYEDWVATTRWEGGFNAYHFSRHPQIHDRILAVEMYGVKVPEVVDMMVVYDIMSIDVEGIGKTMTRPFPTVRGPFGDEMSTDEQMAARSANSLDPLVTMLRLLADASIPIRREEAPEKLNKQRAAKGRHPIPAHSVVDVRDYVANFSRSSSSRGEGKGGHHASPIAHWRRSHLRTLSSGKTVSVKSSRVNWRDTEELHRLFYQLERK